MLRNQNSQIVGSFRRASVSRSMVSDRGLATRAFAPCVVAALSLAVFGCGDQTASESDDAFESALAKVREASMDRFPESSPSGDDAAALQSWLEFDQTAARLGALDSARSDLAKVQGLGKSRTEMLSRIAILEAFNLGKAPRASFSEVISRSVGITRLMTTFETSFSEVEELDPHSDDALAVLEAGKTNQQEILDAIDGRIANLAAARGDLMSQAQTLTAQADDLANQAGALRNQLLELSGRAAFLVSEQVYDITGEAETLRHQITALRNEARMHDSETSVLNNNRETIETAIQSLDGYVNDVQTRAQNMSRDQTSARDGMTQVGERVAAEVSEMIALYETQVAEPLMAAAAGLAEAELPSAQAAQAEFLASELEVLTTHGLLLQVVSDSLEDVIAASESQGGSGAVIDRLNDWRAEALSQAARAASGKLSTYEQRLAELDRATKERLSALNDVARGLQDSGDFPIDARNPEGMQASQAYLRLVAVHTGQLQALPVAPDNTVVAPDAPAAVDPREMVETVVSALNSRNAAPFVANLYQDDRNQFAMGLSGMMLAIATEEDLATAFADSPGGPPAWESFLAVKTSAGITNQIPEMDDATRDAFLENAILLSLPDGASIELAAMEPAGDNQYLVNVITRYENGDVEEEAWSVFEQDGVYWISTSQ